MSLSVETLAVARKYTDDSLAGAGAVAGVPCKIQSITAITGGNRVTFLWTDNNGDDHTSVMDVLNGVDGEDGKGIQSVTVNAQDHLIITYTDGTTVDAGQIEIHSAVDSVNGQTGAVVLDAEDVGALPDNTPIPSKTSDLTNDSGFATTSDVSTALADYTTTADLTTLLAAKQDTLTFDNTPTENSNNPVKSGGVYAVNEALTNQANDMVNVLGAKNLLPNKASIFDYNATKLTFTKNADGSYIINATQETNNFAGINFIVDTGHNLQWLNGLILSGLTDGADQKWAIIINKKASPYTTYTACYTEDVVISGIPDNNDLVEFRLFIWSGQLPTNLIVRPMVRLASIQDDTYEPYSMTNKEMTPYVQAISNPNLLDNPWFTVNQRGANSYGENTNSLDRWFSGDNNQVAISGNVVTLSPVDTSQSCVFFQVFEDEVDGLNGKTVTLSLLDGSGNLYTVSHVVEHKTTWTQLFWKAFNDSFSIGLTAQPLTDGKYRYSFDIVTYATKTLTIKAVKLELGSVSTLTMDTAPNYTAELLKCQRYFYRFKAPHGGFYFALAIVWSTNNMSAIVPVPCMRSAATITPSDFSDFIVSKGASSDSPHNISNFGNYGQSEQNHASGLVITTSENDLVSGDIYVLKAVNANAYIDFSADL